MSFCALYQRRYFRQPEAIKEQGFFKRRLAFFERALPPARLDTRRAARHRTTELGGSVTRRAWQWQAVCLLQAAKIRTSAPLSSRTTAQHKTG